MKNSSGTIRNRNRDLPAFRAVPQPSAPPRTPKKMKMRGNYCVCETYFLKTGTVEFTKFEYVFCCGILVQRHGMSFLRRVKTS